MSKSWNSEQVQAFEAALVEFDNVADSKQRWRQIAKCVPGKTSKECLKRYTEMHLLADAKTEPPGIPERSRACPPPRPAISASPGASGLSEELPPPDKSPLLPTEEEDTSADAAEPEEAVAAAGEDGEGVEEEGREGAPVSDSRRQSPQRRERRLKPPRRWVRRARSAAAQEVDWDTANIEYSEYAQLMSRGKIPPGEPRNVHITQLYMTVGGHDILQMATLKVNDGTHYGLVGRNGIGKTTLLRQMAYHAIHGYPKYLHTLYVKQEVEGTSMTSLETVMRSDTERVELLEREQALLKTLESGDLSAQEELQKVYDRLEAIDSSTAEARASSVLAGLKFTQEQQKMKTSQLSGGWRMRVALACALFLAPDILLLDEPTNHLDLEAVIWLQNYIKTYPRTVIAVSHDRSFLNAIADEIILMKKQSLRYYAGNYDAFVKAKEDHEKRMESAQESLELKREHMLKSIENMKKIASKSVGGGARPPSPQDKGSASIKSRKKKLDRVGMEKDINGHRFKCQTNAQLYGSAIRMGADNANEGGWKNGHRSSTSLVEGEEPVAKFKFPPCSSLEHVIGPVFQLENVSFGFDAKHPLFKRVTMNIDMRCRIALLGANGIGKTTLLNVIQGKYEPLSGSVYKHHNLRIRMFEQHHMDILDLNISALDHMRKSGPDKTVYDHRSYLGGFGIYGQLAMRPMGTLSGGQKSRVVLASIFLDRPHILLLDEPTNHLDLETIEALVAALKTFEGGVMVVTHDQYVVKELCSELWVAEHGTISQFEGTWEDYEDSFSYG